MKLKKALGFILLIAIALVMTYKFMDITPDKNLPQNEQTTKVLTFGQCAACHSHSPNLPFYANWPVIGDVVKEDAALAIREFDITTVTNGINNNQPIDEVTLNKLEYSFQNETMPPVKYYTVHWGSVINNKEKEIVLNWIEQYRAEHHYN
jgi:cytochrome c peroxidase